MSWLGIYGKQGRPPKNWKPSINSILKIRQGNFIIIFD